MHFGEFLIEKNYITQQKLDYALKAQCLLDKANSSIPIGELVHELGMLSKKDLEAALKEFHNF